MLGTQKSPVTGAEPPVGCSHPVPGVAQGRGQEQGQKHPWRVQAGRHGGPLRSQAPPKPPQDSQVLGFRMLLVMGGPAGADMEKSERHSSSWEQPAWMARR